MNGGTITGIAAVVAVTLAAMVARAKRRLCCAQSVGSMIVHDTTYTSEANLASGRASDVTRCIVTDRSIQVGLLAGY